MAFSFRYHVQQYQTDATNAVTDVFKGQPRKEVSYVQDLGLPAKNGMRGMPSHVIGHGNMPIQLDDGQLLDNLNAVQVKNTISPSSKLASDIRKYRMSDEDCRVELDVQMETGTGKTYVYTKTMFELNRLYGWSKFIIIVPSIAIREGVKQSLDDTQEHFFEQYHKKIRSFIYDSSNLNRIDSFSSSSDIQAMIINMQAFNTSFEEGRKNKAARIMFTERDDFGSRKPIDVIAANRPIIIEDEPQKMGGVKTRKAIAQFHPLFLINYTATPKEKHDRVYQLDTLDAYNMRLVKRIEVKGFETKSMTGTDGYVSLQNILTSKNKQPEAVIEFKRMNANGKIVKHTDRFVPGDSLYDVSGPTKLEAYKDFIIAPDGVVPDQDGQLGHVRFLNDVTIHRGEIYGDSTEKDIRTAQIRETIYSHLEKESSLFNRHIKCLSLFFIDKVSNYRQYDADGNPVLGVYGQIFEKEYKNAVADFLNRNSITPAYAKYLRSISASDTHKGYFSIDKKGHAVDGKADREGNSNDESAYDLILKDKERLLSFDEPTRFIFSHSALREGWDNPNIFQICVLKDGNSETTKHQEVGRGLRLCVNSSGIRMDSSYLQDEQEIQQINLLTVIASDSYTDYVKGLEKEIKPELHYRPTTIDQDFFKDCRYSNGHVQALFGTFVSRRLHNILGHSGVIDYDDRPTPKLNAVIKSLDDAALNRVAHAIDPVSKQITDTFKQAFDSSGVTSALQSMTNSLKHVLNPDVFKNLVRNANLASLVGNFNRQNFDKPEFQHLWGKIRRRHVYTTSFSESVLEDAAIQKIDEDAKNGKIAPSTYYEITAGQQKAKISADQLNSGNSFELEQNGSHIRSLDVRFNQPRYDLLGEVSRAAAITRRSAAKILGGIDPSSFKLYKRNPEQFIKQVSDIIRQEAAEQIVKGIRYEPDPDPTSGSYTDSVFINADSNRKLADGIHVEKAVQNYAFPDSEVETNFTNALEQHDEVAVYAKLPRTFQIPTPAGNYAPDWAIVLSDHTARHVYFVTETKGTTDSPELRPVEQQKITCVKKLFKQMNAEGSDVFYHQVDSWDDFIAQARSGLDGTAIKKSNSTVKLGSRSTHELPVPPTSLTLLNGSVKEVIGK